MSELIVKRKEALMGNVDISGSKNSSLPIMAACVLAEGKSRLFNVPDLSDIKTMCRLMEESGSEVEKKGQELEIDCSGISGKLSYDMVSKLRGSFLLAGPLLARCGRVKIPMPGGCPIGTRPIDLHLKGFSALGADISQGHGFVELRAKRLHGNRIYLDFPSVGATENIIMAAATAEGETVIENAATEPEIVDLANFLNSMGADVRGAGTDVIKIRGVEYLHGITYSIIPDQIEAGTYMCAAAATRGCITVKNITPKHLESISAKLREMGVKITEYDEALKVDASSAPLKRCNIKTMPHPGFPTDCQPQFAALLMSVPGTSIINENVWDNRYQYVSELIRMGAQISVEGRLAIIEGGVPLTAAPVKATDLRAGAAMIIAALEINGTTEISNIQFIERGYEDVVEKFRALGADIKKVYFTGDNEQELGA